MELGGDKGDIGWGYGRVPSEGKKGIDRPGIDFSSALDGGKSDRLDGSGGEWKGEGLARCLQSTKIRVAEELVLPQTLEGKKRLRRLRKRTWCG